jgi:hypothetical protein
VGGGGGERVEYAQQQQQQQLEKMQRGFFRVGLGGRSVEVGPASDEFSLRVELSKEGKVTRITVLDQYEVNTEEGSESRNEFDNTDFDDDNDPEAEDDDLMASFAAPYRSSKGGKTRKGDAHKRQTSELEQDFFVLYPARHHVLDEAEKEVRASRVYQIQAPPLMSISVNMLTLCFLCNSVALCVTTYDDDDVSLCKPWLATTTTTMSSPSCKASSLS